MIKDFTPEEFADAFMIRLKPLLQELIREELKTPGENGNESNSKVKSTGISSVEPNVSDKNKYSPKQTCELLGMHRNTLARYTDQGAIKCEIHKHNGRKYYTGHEIKRFWKARY